MAQVRRVLPVTLMEHSSLNSSTSLAISSNFSTPATNIFVEGGELDALMFFVILASDALMIFMNLASDDLHDLSK